MSSAAHILLRNHSFIRTGPFRLLDLPAELRKIIYEHLLPVTIRVAIEISQMHDSYSAFKERFFSIHTLKDAPTEPLYLADNPRRQRYECRYLQGPWNHDYTRRELSAFLTSCRDINTEMGPRLHNRMWLESRCVSGLAIHGTVGPSWMHKVKRQSIHQFWPSRRGKQLLQNPWSVSDLSNYRYETAWIPILARLSQRLEVLEISRIPLYETSCRYLSSPNNLWFSRVYSTPLPTLLL